MNNSNLLEGQLERNKKIREKLAKNVEDVFAVQKVLSPTYNLINQSNLNNLNNVELQSKLVGINTTSLGIYEDYLNDRKKVHEQIKDTINKLNVQQSSIQSISESLKQMKPVTPFELLVNTDIPKFNLEKINQEFYDTDWNEVIDESTADFHDLELFYIDFVTKEPEKFASDLYGYIEEIDDDELNSIFTLDFLSEITKSWWIIPKFELEDYKKLSQRNATDSDLNQLILSEYYTNPELIFDLISSWDIVDERRLKIIIQAFDNYSFGNYEICVLTLLLQIEGLMRDKLQLKDTGGILRKKLESKIDDYLEENSTQYPPWGIFLIKSFKSYLWMILNPLDGDVNFLEDDDEINRNITCHVGFVKANQKIAIRLFLIIDTLMFLFESI